MLSSSRFLLLKIESTTCTILAATRLGILSDCNDSLIAYHLFTYQNTVFNCCHLTHFVKRQSKVLEMLAARSNCLSSTSVRPVDRSYDKLIDGINRDNGSYSDGCARSQCCSLKGIQYYFLLYC